MNNDKTTQLTQELATIEDAKLLEPQQEPLVPTTAEYVVSEEEEAYRRQPEKHRRLKRRLKPRISQERLEELFSFAVDGRLRPQDEVPLRLGLVNGVMTEKDLVALRAADAKRERKRLKRQARTGDTWKQYPLVSR